MSEKSLRRWVANTIGCVSMLGFSTSAFAYIDPGVTYALLQALFIFAAGAATAFIVRPWTWVKSWFKKSDTEAHIESMDSETESNTSSNSTDK